MGAIRASGWTLLGAAAAAAGCASVLPPPADPTEVEADAPAAAFVVYREGSTLLVPLLAEAPGGSVVEAAGLWLLAEDGEVLVAEVVDRARLADGWACPPAEAPADACPTSRLDEAPVALVVSRLDPEAGGFASPRLAGALEGCSCFRDEPVEEDAAGSGPEAGPAEAAPTCSAEARPYGAVSLVGGRVHLLARLDGSSCEGARPLAFWAEAVPLLPEEPGEPDLAEESCVAGVPFDDWSTLDRPCPGRSRRPSCAGCAEPLVEAVVPLSWSGRLVELGISPGERGEAVTLVRSAEVGPETCPGPADPCGSPAGFPGLDRWEASWVAADGVAALGLSEGRLSVLLPGVEEPLWGGVEVGGEVIGVRYHEDAEPLRRAMAEGP